LRTTGQAGQHHDRWLDVPTLTSGLFFILKADSEAEYEPKAVADIRSERRPSCLGHLCAPVRTLGLHLALTRSTVAEARTADQPVLRGQSVARARHSVHDRQLAVHGQQAEESRPEFPGIHECPQKHPWRVT